jgi:hypothetical protein
MLDPQSIGTGQLRLRDAIGMKAVCVEELINGAAQDAAYFGYLATAMNAVVEPSLAKLIPEHDKLLKLAEADAVVFIPQNASWPVERAAHVLGMELLRATRRLATLKDLAPPEKSPSAFVMRVTTERLPAELGARNAILVIPPSSDDWARASDAPPVPSDKSGIIAARQTGGKTHIVLRGATQQDTLYLVDYLLDLAWSPLHGRWPAERAVSVLQELWSGWKLIRDLGGMSGAAAVAYARKLPYHHNQTRAEDATKYAAALKQGVHSPASEEEWWSYFLLEIPLPDGRRVADLIEKGADYSALIEIVSR